ncbi:hypothetical protein CEUSTIGMA_g12734.t1 [Chlamydomonas eustigma]|uniref:protein-disulfide reductase n=1 Tax=Chlamydomonas eustigma TaxID=1157962 RepID=A0A250XQG8_9CHLO|nr:hypothetical protein CEUSTIGMA_g12734.t1 [Chlamydomonas eustigma]|eukprot:GAX85317.1 hypothetical protein CEUSTIGMA_g12734.t1 [Chlamydomonas eustigma]
MEKVNIRELLGPTILTRLPEQAEPSHIDTETLEGKYVGLLFSRAFVPTCFRFAPKLKDVYDKQRESGTSFEVVLIPLDSSQESCDEQYSTMPWSCLPWGSPEIQSLKKQFAVTTPPVLVMISPDGHILSRDARLGVKDTPKDFPWKSVEAAVSSSYSFPPLRCKQTVL